MASTAVAGTIPSSKTLTQQPKEAHVVLAPREKLRLEYRPPLFRITDVWLDFKLDAEGTEVYADLSVYREEGTPPDSDLVLDGEELRLDSVLLNEKVLEEGREYKVDEEGSLIVEGKLLPAKPREIFHLKTKVFIYPKNNLELSGLYKSGDILCTQCEAEGFRRITFFLDRPDVMARFRVRLEADKTHYTVLLSNGDLVESGDIEDGRHFVVFDDPHLKPAYLFAVVAGNLQALEGTHVRPPVDGQPGRPVRISIWHEPKDEGKLDWAMEAIKKAMKWDEDRFGRVYDLDWFNIVCVSFFNMGAMENKSLNIFNSALLLASTPTSTDMDFLHILGVVGHEYFHNWTGNRVTCRDWFQLTLKEGLTVFRDQEFSSDMGSAAVKRVEDVVELRARQFPEDAGPMSHPIRPEAYVVMDNFYTSTVYEKGAEVIRMYQTLLGKDGFKKGMDLYFKRHDGQAVTCDDFRSAMADANGVDLTQFERWYLQGGTPEVHVDFAEWDKKEKKFRITLRQHTPPTPNQPKKLPLHIPVRVGLVGRKSLKDVVEEKLLELTKEQQTFEFDEPVEEDVVPSVLRNFSAPVKLRYELPQEDLAFLFAHDSDEFNRWEAGQKLLSNLLLERANELLHKKYSADSLPPTPGLIIEAFRSLLKKSDVDVSLKALAMELPLVASLETDMEPECCPVSLYEARKGVKKQLAVALKSDFERLYEDLTNDQSAPNDLSPTAVGKRAMRNLCLNFLSALEDEAAEVRAENHFKAAQCMTDRMAAFRCLLNLRGPRCEAAIESFYEEAKDNALTLNKWFGAQASAQHNNVLDEVERLRNHPAFDLKNPNRFRSLFMRFAFNLPNFHRPDGKGYDLVCDGIMQIDAVNSSVAARLATTLISWKHLGPQRQQMIRSALKKIAAKPGLSSATFEIVNKGLAV